jgi:hypothetical protein
VSAACGISRVALPSSAPTTIDGAALSANSVAGEIGRWATRAAAAAAAAFGILRTIASLVIDERARALRPQPATAV